MSRSWIDRNGPKTSAHEKALKLTEKVDHCHPSKGVQKLPPYFAELE
jgi:hypothetical protein